MERVPQLLVGLLIPLGFFAMVAMIVWLRVRKSQAETRARAEVQKQLLEKFSSAHEFTEFLGSTGGQRFLEGVWLPQAHVVNAKDRILRSVRTGVVLSVLGLAMLGLSWMRSGLVVPGVLVVALGIGFLLSTAISYRLSRKLDLQEREPGRSQEPVSQN